MVWCGRHSVRIPPDWTVIHALWQDAIGFAADAARAVVRRCDNGGKALRVHTRSQCLHHQVGMAVRFRQLVWVGEVTTPKRGDGPSSKGPPGLLPRLGARFSSCLCRLGCAGGGRKC